MSVIPFTIFFSLLLAGLFIVLFAHEQRRRRFASPERDSLLLLLWLAQANFHRVRAQSWFPLAIAALLIWRLRGTLGLGGPGAGDFLCF